MIHQATTLVDEKVVSCSCGWAYMYGPEQSMSDALDAWDIHWELANA